MQRKHERVIQYLENYFIARFARLEQIVVVFTCQRKTYYHTYVICVCLFVHEIPHIIIIIIIICANKQRKKKRRCRPPLSVDEMAILAKETVVLPFLD